MAVTQMWSLGHIPALDGLRGVAVLLVMVFHSGVTPLEAAGPVGVTVFFTLSGFLITALLLDERARNGRISLADFYRRRAVRLLPALLLYLAVMGTFARLSDAGAAPSRRDFLGTIFYVSNYTTAMQGSDNVLLHTWSLAVEEQFYIVWPLVVVAALAMARRRSWLLAMAGLGSVLAIVLRLLLWDDGRGWERVYYGTDTHMDGLLVGCAAALWAHRRATWRGRPGLALVGLAALVLLSLGSGAAKFLLAPTLVPLVTAGVILAVAHRPEANFLTNAMLRLIGRRSYGIYLWHFPLFGIAASLPAPSRWLALTIALLFTFAIAHLSWRCVEEPALRLRRRAASRVPATHESSGATDPAGLSR